MSGPFDLRALLAEALRSPEGRAVLREVLAEELAAGGAGATGDEWITVRRATELASVSPPTIRRWLRSGQIATSGNGRGLRLSRRDLERYLANRGRASGAETESELVARLAGG